MKINIYADDTAITVTASKKYDMKQQLNTVLAIVFSWTAQNTLSLNLKKTFYCTFGTHGKCKEFLNMDIRHHDESISQSDTGKYFGMKLDKQLSFNEHAAYIHSKTIGKIIMLSRIRGSLDQSTSLMLYKTLILPIFDYWDIIYNCLSQKTH